MMLSSLLFPNSLPRRVCSVGMLCVWFVGVVVLSSAVADERSKSTTWLIVRHAEREGAADSLSSAGSKRAQQLSQIGEALNATAIYTTNFERTKSTVEPLARALKLEPIVYAKVNSTWLEKIKAQNAGGVVVIVGHSNTAGVIAGKLADVPAIKIGHDDYDNLFIVKTDANGGTLLPLKFGSPVASSDVR